MSLIGEDSEIKFISEQLEIARRKEIFQPGENVKALFTAWKYSMMIFFFGLFARLLQKRYLVAVTDQRVVLIHVPAFLIHSDESKYFQWVAVDRPCPLKLTGPPQKQHQMGNELVLPEVFAAFVGRPSVRVVWGLRAQEGITLASQPPEK
ncbi:hypothetical protein MYX77_04965 [Acidobacteriia bacterium AH_259_A11_L15]|nr:hypothetical protein [Acidobacteriia bacterium AH_259_A11_L15]